MTTFAKIFVGVNLVLTLAVFGANSALLGAQANYKEALEEYQKKYAQIRQKNDKDKAKLTQERDEQATVASNAELKRQQTEADNNRLTNDLERAHRLNQSLTAANEKTVALMQAIKDVQSNIDNTLKALVSSSDENHKRMLEFKKKYEDALTAKNNTESQLSIVTEERDKLAADLETARRGLREAELQIADFKRRLPPGGAGAGKAVEGSVLRVDGDFVIVSIGTADGLRVGDSLNVSRGSRYVGKVKITKVERNDAIARWQPDFKGTVGPPQERDRVYNR